MVWGPDDYLWVTERTAGRVTRVLPSDGSTTPAIAIGDVLADGPGGLLGMALDPGLLKGTGNDYVYVAYTYDADADPATVSRRTKIVRFTYDPRAHVLGNARDILAGLPAGTDHQGGRLDHRSRSEAVFHDRRPGGQSAGQLLQAQSRPERADRRAGAGRVTGRSTRAKCCG